MLKKKFRLSMVKKIERAKTLTSPFFILKYCENGETVSRFAFVISKKIDKRAVIRNKIKREMSKGVEKIINDIGKGYDFIFIARKQILENDQKEITSLIEEFFKKNKFLN